MVTVEKFRKEHERVRENGLISRTPYGKQTKDKIPETKHTQIVIEVQ